MLGAILGGAAILGGSLLSGYLGSRAAGKAADATEQAAEIAAMITRELFYVGREDLRPYTEIGQEAINRLTGEPAVYAATPEELTNLVNQRDDLQARITEMETKGIPYQKRVRQYTQDQIRDMGGVVNPYTIEQAYKPADPSEIAKLKSDLADLEKQITDTQASIGEVVTEAQPGLLDQFPELPEYPEMPAYPQLPAPPTAGPYPDLAPMPTFDFGQGGTVGGTGGQNAYIDPATGEYITPPEGATAVPGGAQNALISFTPEAYEQSPGYQWQVDEAQKAVERMAAARGYRLSPRAAEEFMNQAQGLAKTDYYNWLGSQFQKADLALQSWREGRTAQIQDWLMPYQMQVADWELARGTSLEDWQNQRNSIFQDWYQPAVTKAANWMDKYNALLNLLRTGESAAAGQASQAGNVGTNLANLNLVSGQAQADKYINQANALTGALSSGINNALLLYGLNNGNQAQNLWGVTTAQPNTFSWDYLNSPNALGYAPT